jgi:hypothetical protein
MNLSIVEKTILNYCSSARSFAWRFLCLWGFTMLGFIVLVRNLVLAAALAWLGLEFAPDQDDQQEAARQDTVVTALLGR